MALRLNKEETAPIMLAEMMRHTKQRKTKADLLFFSSLSCLYSLDSLLDSLPGKRCQIRDMTRLFPNTSINSMKSLRRKMIR